MKQYKVLLKKEWKQFLMEWKIIWFPIVFILLGLMQPVVTYYMPLLLETFGGSEGITIDPLVMKQTSGEVLASTIGSQFDQLGVMVIVISIMGMIQMDRKDGMLDIILTKPVSLISYVLSKYSSHLLLVLFSISVGYLISYGYTVFLFDPIPIQNVLLGFAYYSFWIAFIVALVLLMSAVFKQTAILAISSIGILFMIHMMKGWNRILDLLLPSTISAEAMNQIITGQGSEIFIHIVVTVLWSIILIYLTVQKLSIRKE
ncbi:MULTISPECIES: ABC transporter permease [unclassified Oceanobacillus]